MRLVIKGWHISKKSTGVNQNSPGTFVWPVVRGNCGGGRHGIAAVVSNKQMKKRVNRDLYRNSRENRDKPLLSFFSTL